MIFVQPFIVEWMIIVTNNIIITWVNTHIIAEVLYCNICNRIQCKVNVFNYDLTSTNLSASMYILPK